MSDKVVVLDVDMSETISRVATRALHVANAQGSPVYYIYDGALAMACPGWTAGEAVTYWAQVHRRVWWDERVPRKVPPESLWGSAG